MKTLSTKKKFSHEKDILNALKLYIIYTMYIYYYAFKELVIRSTTTSVVSKLQASVCKFSFMQMMHLFFINTDQEERRQSRFVTNEPPSVPLRVNHLTMKIMMLMCEKLSAAVNS